MTKRSGRMRSSRVGVCKVLRSLFERMLPLLYLCNVIAYAVAWIETENIVFGILAALWAVLWMLFMM
jgi:hypothetical protein